MHYTDSLSILLILEFSGRGGRKKEQCGSTWGGMPEEEERRGVGEKDRIRVFPGSAWGQHFMIFIINSYQNQVGKS